MSRPAKIFIDLAAVEANYKYAQILAPNSNAIAVVKADAYGHGAVEVAKKLASSAELFAVSCLEEALVLRQAGIEQSILLLEGCFSQDEIPLAVTQNCQLVVHTQQQIDELLNADISQPVSVWLKVDTGMHRLGIQPDEAAQASLTLKASKNVKAVLLMSHFSSADNLASDGVSKQLDVFENCVSTIKEIGIQKSMANSAGILAWPNSHKNWNRPGIMLYGLSPFSEYQPQASQLQAAMSFESEIIAMRDVSAGESVGYGDTWVANRPSVVATVAVGYGDGYPRTAKLGTPVLVNKQRVPLAGRVSMDMISIDVTGLQNVNIGDKVELWGKNLGANEVAFWADTIGYELVTRMPTRAKRLFI
ncbi:MAG: alanine racemase [Paraglaciecola sp.]|uniref:alanine racemase n=2 Tax=Paraglaciecola sp. TaxID=1920173 RepID=UPI003266F84F